MDFLQFLDQLGDEVFKAIINVDVGILVVNSQNYVFNAILFAQLWITNNLKLA